MKVISVVGARPQFVKLAPMEKAFARAGIAHGTAHTGQHYDYQMSDSFFDSLGIVEPAWNLGIGSGSHGAQTGSMLAALDELIDRERPDWVLVYGDTNSTVAAALAAVKLHVPVAHLEAGLRSFNRRMPEEHNRVLTDHAADLLLAPTLVAAQHLADEGLSDRTVVVGDVMVDVLLAVADSLDVNDGLDLGGLDLSGGYVLATIHRAENTDDPDRLAEILTALADMPLPVVLPVHPRVRELARALGIELGSGNLRPVEPLSYPEMVATVRGARAVATDSGGLQKEAFVLGTPTTTIRTETEWVETLDNGWNVLSPDVTDLAAVVLRSAPQGPKPSPYGDGHAADAAVEAITSASA